MRKKYFILLTHTVASRYNTDTQPTIIHHITTYKEYQKIVKFIKKNKSVISYNETVNGFEYSTDTHEYTLTYDTTTSYTKFNKSVLFK